MDKEMLEAMRAMFDERDERLSRMIDAKLQPIKTEIAEIMHRQGEQAEFERGTRVLVENVNKNIRLLAEGHGINASKLQNLDRIEMTLNDVKSDTEVIKDVVSWHSDAIEKLKKHN